MSWTTVHVPTKQVLWAGKWHPTWNKSWAQSSYKNAQKRMERSFDNIQQFAMLLDSVIIEYDAYRKEEWHRGRAIDSINREPDFILQYGMDLLVGAKDLSGFYVGSNHPSSVWHKARMDGIRYDRLDTYLEMNQELFRDLHHRTVHARIKARIRGIKQSVNVEVEYDDYLLEFAAAFDQVRPTYTVSSFFFFENQTDAMRFKLASPHDLKLGSLKKLQEDSRAVLGKWL